MALSALKEKITALLEKDRKEEALSTILKQLKTNTPARDAFVQVQGRLSKLKKDIALELISYEDQTINFSRIRVAILTLLADLMDEDLAPSEASSKSAELNLNELDLLEQQGLKRQAELLLKKINRTREALALEDDPGRQIRYETQLEQWEEELSTLKQRAGL